MKIAAFVLLALAGVAYATENPTKQSSHVMARIEFDNTEKEVNANLPTIKKNIAKELCGVPETDVTIVKIINDDKKVAGIGDTQTVVYAACKAPNNKLEGVRDDCEDLWNKHQLKDETQDKTGSWFFNAGEVKVDDIECKYVEANKFVFFDRTDAKKAAAAPNAAANDAAVAAVNSGSPAPQSAATSSLPSMLGAAAAAAGAGALVLML